MVTSMTGHGQASIENDHVRAVVEIRTVNNRFLKTVINSDLGSTVDAKIESLVKQYVNRGSVTVRVKTTYLSDQSQFQLNENVVRGYWLQLSEIAGSSQAINLESVLQLPGVIAESNDRQGDEVVWNVVEVAVQEALTRLREMRNVEGSAMKTDMLSNVKAITNELKSVKQLAPTVAESYSKRMTDRINQLLEKHNVSITSADIVREVGIFADRCDISEETVRLASHLEQFDVVIEQPENCGKKLDFLIQEMLRETNTIGSKANDSSIAKHVVEIKSSIERIREMVQNIE